MRAAQRITVLAGLSAVSLLLSLVIRNHEPVHANGFSLNIKVFKAADPAAAVKSILAALSLPPGEGIAIKGSVGRSDAKKSVQASLTSRGNGDTGAALKLPKMYKIEIGPPKPKPGDPKAQMAMTRVELSKFGEQLRRTQEAGGGKVKYASLGNLGDKRMKATYQVRLDPIGPVTFKVTKLATN